MTPINNLSRALRLACLCALLGAFSIAQCAAAEATSDDVALNFVNADIDAVIRAMSKITHRNFVVDPRVKGTLNIVTNTPVSPDLAYQMLLSALRLQGYAIVEGRGVTEVVPEADAKLHSVPVTTGGAALRGDRLATQIFAIKNESAAQLVQVIRPLVSPNNTVTAYANNNTLVVTDYAENLQRISRIIDAIDVPQSDVVVMPVQYASAIDLASTVNRLLSAGPSGSDASQHITVIADERTNALLVHSDNPSRINTVRQLLKSLDQQGVTGNVHVIYLKNAEAESLARTLRGVLSGEVTEAAATSQPSLSQGTTGSTTGSMSGTAGGTGRGATPSFSNKSSTSGGGGGGGSLVQADALTNSLIVTAPDPVYNNIRRVVEMLDRRRAQVYVEALIAEITSDRNAEFGIQWQSANVPTAGSSKSYVFGGTNFSSGGSNIIGLTQNLLSAAPGLNLIVGGRTIDVPDGKGGTIPVSTVSALARFLESQNNTNILSTPNLVMLDNEEAKIVVGQNVPFVTGSYASTTTGTNTANPFQTYTREDVGLTLKIKPQISEGGSIHLQIYEESSSVIASSASNASGPTTNKRSLETTALVDDGTIIALGGLVQDTYTSGVDKVPLLGDIPLLGNLFKYDTRQRTKTNLVIFLRPKILRSAEDYRGLSVDRYDYVIGQQKSLDSPDRLMRNEAPAPQLPESAAPAADAKPAPAAVPAPPPPATAK